MHPWNVLWSHKNPSIIDWESSNWINPVQEIVGYSLEWCGVMSGKLNFSRFKETGWKVIGVSTDSANSHEKFANKFELPFDLVVDTDSHLHKLYKLIYLCFLLKMNLSL